MALPTRTGAPGAYAGAVAGAPRGRGLEAPSPNAGRRRLDGLGCLLEIVRGRRVATDDVRVDEAQLQPLRQAPRHLPPGQRIHLELETSHHPAVGVLLAGDFGRLVVDDHRTQEVLVHTVVAAAHAVRSERKAEFLFHP